MVDVQFRGGFQLSRRNFGSRIVPLKHSIANRIVEPEILDEMPANDPRAIASRRDLRRLNYWLNHHRHVKNAILTAFPVDVPHTLVEIGSGDGRFASQTLAYLDEAWPFPDTRDVYLVDRQTPMDTGLINQFEESGWRAHSVQADIFDWLPKQKTFDCIIANLFLHHFAPDQLRSLFEMIAAHTKVFIACEPRRCRTALYGGYLLVYATCSSVTRHDGIVSIRAGFKDNELSRLWPPHGWTLRENKVGIVNHLFVAMKR
jgi:SAM-dependent methyltransferase